MKEAAKVLGKFLGLIFMMGLSAYTAAESYAALVELKEDN